MNVMSKGVIWLATRKFIRRLRHTLRLREIYVEALNSKQSCEQLSDTERVREVEAPCGAISYFLLISLRLSSLDRRIPLSLVPRIMQSSLYL